MQVSKERYKNVSNAPLGTRTKFTQADKWMVSKRPNPNPDKINEGSLRLRGAKVFGGERETAKLSRYARRWEFEPALGRVAHGVPNRVDRIAALGEAIVPQVAAEIFRAMRAVDEKTLDSSLRWNDPGSKSGAGS